jgi:hypothetical protein
MPIFYQEWSHKALGSHLGQTEGQDRVHGVARYPSHGMWYIWHLVTLLPSIFALISSSWSKTFYKRGPDRDLRARRTWNTKLGNIGCTNEGWRRKHHQSVAGLHQQHLPHLHDGNRVVHPGLWACGSSLFYLLPQCFRVSWAALVRTILL